MFLELLGVSLKFLHAVCPVFTLCNLVPGRCCLTGSFNAGDPCPEFTLESTEASYETRLYKKATWASTTVEGLSRVEIAPFKALKVSMTRLLFWRLHPILFQSHILYYKVNVSRDGHT